MREPIVLDSSLSRRLVSMLQGPQVEISSWQSRLVRLEAEYGSDVYRHLFYVLGRLDLHPREAKTHWEEAESAWMELSERLGRPIDLRVAVLGYLLQRQQKLWNPALVEIELLRKTEALAMRDELTELHNYRYFRERISQETERVRRYGSSLSLLMIDVDDFKRFNDEQGHPAGNDALKKLASVFVRSVRAVDLVSRYGGEEFATLLPSTSRAGAMVVAEKIRDMVRTAGIGASSGNEPLTVSVGVASFPGDATEVNSLVEHADLALYSAKAAGRDCVRAFSADRRESPRHEAFIAGRLRSLGETNLPITTLDLSQGGLCFEIREELSPGNVIQVELSLPESPTELECTCRVVSVRPGDGGFTVGARFIHLEGPHSSRLRQFMESLDKPATTD